MLISTVKHIIDIANLGAGAKADNQMVLMEG